MQKFYAGIAKKKKLNKTVTLSYIIMIFFYIFFLVMMDEPRFAQPIPNVTVAVGRDANLPCVVEHLGTYKVCMRIYIFFFPLL